MWLSFDGLKTWPELAPLGDLLRQMKQVLALHKFKGRLESMWVSGNVWHSGMNSAVRFAAMMPAIRAISSG